MNSGNLCCALSADVPFCPKAAPSHSCKAVEVWGVKLGALERGASQQCISWHSPFMALIREEHLIWLQLSLVSGESSVSF